MLMRMIINKVWLVAKGFIQEYSINYKEIFILTIVIMLF